MKRTGWLGILLLAWISVTAGLVTAPAGLAAEQPSAAVVNVWDRLSGSGDGDAALTDPDGDPDDVIGGNKDHSGVTDDDVPGDLAVRDLRLIEEFLRYLSELISLRF